MCSLVVIYFLKDDLNTQCLAKYQITAMNIGFNLLFFSHFFLRVIAFNFLKLF